MNTDTNQTYCISQFITNCSVVDATTDSEKDTVQNELGVFINANQIAKLDATENLFALRHNYDLSPCFLQMPLTDGSHPHTV